MLRVLFMMALICFSSVACAAQTQVLRIETQSGKSYNFQVELAQNDTDRAKGLMNRKSLAANAGMLFVFDGQPEAVVSFWMKDTYIPLDMLFIGRDGVIKSIHENAKPLDLEPISSKLPVSYVLELAGGTARLLGIKAGDRVFSDNFFGKKLAP